MRLLKKEIHSKHGEGYVTLLPEEPEDMWLAYNMIQPTDSLRAQAWRKVSKETEGMKSQQRVVMNLTITVTSTDFDIGASQLHVAGRVSSENEFVKLGSYQTLHLDLNKQFTLVKAEGWDSVALEVLQDACASERRAELWAVVMGVGIANICLITEHRTILRQRVEIPVPRKRKGGQDGHEKGMDKFFATTLSTLLRDMEIENAPKSTDKTIPLLLASPGFVAQDFMTYMRNEAVRTANKPLQELTKSVLVAHSSSYHVHSLQEVLSSPEFTRKLSDTKFARETALMDKFMTYMRQDDGRAWYGPKEVERAVEKGAVGRGGGVLLISNALFRSQKVAERKRWVELVDRVKEVEGGEVRILSSLHESGKRLEGLGDVAAILTFPLENLDEEEEVEVEGGLEDENEVMII